MRIVYLITAHKNPLQIARLVNRLNDDNVSFIIHIEKNADDVYEEVVRLIDLENVRFLEKRTHYVYQGYGIVQATLDGIVDALENEGDFDYVINLSGQDYPIKSNKQIKEFFSANRSFSFLHYYPLPFSGWLPNGGLNRIESWYVEIGDRLIKFPLNPAQFSRLHKMKLTPILHAVNFFIPRKRAFFKNFQPYGGWAFCCFTRKHAEYAIKFLNENPSFVRYFKRVSAPDEMIFQTLLINSPHKEECVNNDLRHIEWIEGDTHPKIYVLDDFSRLASSDRLFARKFDPAIDEKILDKIDKELLGINSKP